MVWACWIVYGFYWVISAASTKPAAERQSRTGIFAHRVPVWLGFLLLFVRPLDRLHWRLLEHGAALAWTGAALCAAGVFLAIASRRVLASNWSINVEFKQDHELIQRGPYRLIRHPIYSAILLMTLGAGLATNRLIPMFSTPLVLAGFLIKLKQEEKLMTRHFPAEYPAYQARTKMLTPFLF